MRRKNQQLILNLMMKMKKILNGGSGMMHRTILFLQLNLKLITSQVNKYTIAMDEDQIDSYSQIMDLFSDITNIILLVLGFGLMQLNSMNSMIN